MSFNCFRIPSLTHRINLILNEVLTKADGMRTLLKTLIFNAKLISTDLELQKSFEDFQGAGTSTLFNLQKVRLFCEVFIVPRD